MSDALLERIAAAAEGLLAHLKKAPAATPAAAGKPATTAAPRAAATPAAAGKPATTAAPRAAAGKPATAPAATKAPGGKYTSEQVREAIRKVALNPNLGKASALDILDQDGAGVTKVADLKPENFDSVYEACQALLSGEGEGAPVAAEDDFS